MEALSRSFRLAGQLRRLQGAVTTDSGTVRVAVVGACCGAGWPAALLLKRSGLLAELRLHDWTPRARGLAAELETINTACRVRPLALQPALTGADVVLFCSDTPPVFRDAACKTREVAEAVNMYCPDATLVVSAQPVNSLVPLAAEVMQVDASLDFGRVLGVASLDSIRASGLLARLVGLAPHRVHVPVVGGVPVLSSAHPAVDWRELRELMGAEGSSPGPASDPAPDPAPGPAPGPTTGYSAGYAAARTVLSVVRALRGQRVIETVFIRSDQLDGTRYLSTAVELCGGSSGPRVRALDLPNFSPEEAEALRLALPAIARAVEAGECFARQGAPPQ